MNMSGSINAVPYVRIRELAAEAHVSAITVIDEGIYRKTGQEKNRSKAMITTDMIQKIQDAWNRNPQVRVLQSAASKTMLSDIAYVPGKAAALEGPFSLELETGGATNQKKSGRCWLYAAMNIMRKIVAKQCNLKEFELSGNYLAFWDKLEKCNDFLELVIAGAGQPMEDRENEQIFRGIGDGGYWDMAVRLIKKYGVVPAWIMPETYQSENTSQLMDKVNTLLRKDGLELRKWIGQGRDVRARKEEMLGELYQVFCICFGQPVSEFDFEYRDRDNRYHADRHLTPFTFYEKYIGMALDDYITICNEETERKPLYRCYTFHYAGSMAGEDQRFLNLPMPDVKSLMLRQMEDGEPVWFSCDSDQGADRKAGIWDPDSFDYGAILGGLDLSMTKTERLISRESRLDHAMIMVGVNLDEAGNPNRWKIENSWGTENGRKGYFVASDAYVDEFVYQAIIHKKYLDEKQLAAYEAEPVALNPWEV